VPPFAAPDVWRIEPVATGGFASAWGGMPMRNRQALRIRHVLSGAYLAVRGKEAKANYAKHTEAATRASAAADAGKPSPSKWVA
jgi:hypothetical protein